MKKKDVVGFIIISNVKNEKYWEGKGFCNKVVKQYFSMQECFDAISAYWMPYEAPSDDRDITFKAITEKNLETMLEKGIRIQ